MSRLAPQICIAHSTSTGHAGADAHAQTHLESCCTSGERYASSASAENTTQARTMSSGCQLNSRFVSLPRSAPLGCRDTPPRLPNIQQRSTMMVASWLAANKPRRTCGSTIVRCRYLFFRVSRLTQVLCARSRRRECTAVRFRWRAFTGGTRMSFLGVCDTKLHRASQISVAAPRGATWRSMPGR